MDIGKLYEKQISLSEWFEGIGYEGSAKFRDEDNEKRERLKVLKEVCGVPFDEPVKFEATDVANRSEAVMAYVNEHADESCALRLIPKTPDVEKLRIRGKSVRDSLDWFDEQKVDATKYRAEYLPNASDYVWSTIFVVTEKGVFGEIIKGAHHQLTQGFYDEGVEPIQFSYDFETWSFSHDNEDAHKEMKETVARILVEDEKKQAELAKRLDAEFASNHLKGYFESSRSESMGFWMFDYNRTMSGLQGADLPVFQQDAKEALLSGKTGNPGIAEGIVNIVEAQDLEKNDFKEGEVLVCDMTTPAHLPLMIKAAAVVTNQGGILTHAAIVCRELKKPCVVGTKDATQKLAKGDRVQVDAAGGTITRL